MKQVHTLVMVVTKLVCRVELKTRQLYKPTHVSMVCVYTVASDTRWDPTQP